MLFIPYSMVAFHGNVQGKTHWNQFVPVFPVKIHKRNSVTRAKGFVAWLTNSKRLQINRDYPFFLEHIVLFIDFGSEDRQIASLFEFIRGQYALRISRLI